MMLDIDNYNNDGAFVLLYILSFIEMKSFYPYSMCAPIFFPLLLAVRQSQGK